MAMGRILFRIEMFLRRMGYEIDRRLPLLCDCGHWTAKQNALVETTTWGRRVSYCPDCHRRIFLERY
jgi:hypothetical protein